MNIKGKTFEEYLADFESEYNECIYTNIPTTQNDEISIIEKLWDKKNKEKESKFHPLVKRIYGDI